MITGEYNELGYEIFSDGKSLYTAGNSPRDSGTTVSPKQGIGLKTLRRYCLQTARDMAEERGEEFGGVHRVDSEGNQT